MEWCLSVQQILELWYFIKHPAYPRYVATNSNHTMPTLARINAVESDQCRCGRGEESVDHFLFRCPRWSIFRGEIRRLAGRRWGDTSYLLGGWSGEPKDGDAAKWKPANEMVTATINFAIATGRLEDKRKGRGESNDGMKRSPRGQTRRGNPRKFYTTHQQINELHALHVDIADAWLLTTGILLTDRSSHYISMSDDQPNVE